MLHSNHYVLAALVGLAAVFSSCSTKDALDVQPAVEKSKVFLNLQRFGFEEAGLTKATDSQAPHRIVFKAFDSSGAAVFDTTQVAGQQGYGSLEFELDPGAYTFVAVAHDVALTGNPAFNPSTGLASGERQYVKEVDLSGGKGTSNNSISLNLLLTSEEQSIDITATTYNTEGEVIASHTLTDVPMKLNRTTIARGNFFTTESRSTFSFLTGWEGDNNISY